MRSERMWTSCTVFVVVGHVEVALHSRSEHRVAVAGQDVGLPAFSQARIYWDLKVHHNGVHDLGKGGNVDAVAAKA